MILITGATGLLGSYLTRLLLSKGEKVRAIKRPASDFSLLGEAAAAVEWVEGDILDIPSLEAAMKGVEKVYHCAAHISLIPSETEYMMAVNIEGTANVMNAALYNGVKRMLHVSSIAAFGTAAAGKIMDENYADPNIGKSFSYYRSKQYGEREAWRAHAEGLEVVIACPSTILGAGWWDEEPVSLFRDVYQGLKFYVSSTIGFVDVRDAANSLYCLMESGIQGEKFIVSSENLSFRDVIWQIADSLQVKRPSMEAGKWLLALAWRMELIKNKLTGARPILTRESAKISLESFLFSNEKISAIPGCRFRPVKETIADTARVFLESTKAGRNYGVFS